MKNIKNYLKSYIKNEINLNEAILITSNWGSGKTYFIKNLIKEVDNNVKVIYISLFGVNSTKDIREKIYEAFHPFLSDNKVKLIKDVLKGAVNAKLKVDLDEKINKSFGEEIEKYLKVEIDENKTFRNFLKFIDFSKNDKNRYDTILYIFDDLERIVFNENIVEVLGFINELVEQNRAKVILIADENVLSEKFNEYSYFKEKIVAKTFKLSVLEIDTILDELIDEYSDKCKEFIKKNSIILKEVFRNSKSNNLRALKQILAEWCYWYEKIDKKIKKNEHFKEFFKVFVSIFFEVKIKDGLFLDIAGLEKVENIFFEFIEKKNKEKSKREKFLKKYNLANIFLSGVLWKRILYNEIDDINGLLFNIEVFKPQPKPPCWYIIGNYIEYNEDEFEKCLEKVIKDFTNCEFKEDWIFLNVVNALLFFSEEEIITLEKSEIEKIALNCINKFKDIDSWREKEFRENIPFSTNFRHFTENEEPFKSIAEKLKKAKNEKHLEYLAKNKEEDFDKFLKAIKNSDMDTIVKILLETYRQKPFFIGLDSKKIEEFFDILKNCPIRSISLFAQVLNDRFNDNYLISNGYKNVNNWFFLTDEIDFYISLKKLIEKDIQKMKVNRKLILNNLINTLNTVIGKLAKV